MGKKNKKKRDGIVFSTDPDFEYAYREEAEPESLPPAQQRLRVLLDRKQRKGKEVTLVDGYVGPEEELKDLGKQLKNRCGVGGSVKEGQILLQGDQREKAVAFLLDQGYTNTRRSGG